VQQGGAFEKRNVKVGVSDFFYAEIQQGLKAGEVVSLELPKEERDKKARQVASQKKNSGETAGAGAKMAGGQASGSRTNSAPAGGEAASTASTAGKASGKSGPGSPGASGAAR